MSRILAVSLSLSLGLCALAQGPVTVRMMAGPYQGIPPREATDSRSLARWAVFD